MRFLERDALVTRMEWMLRLGAAGMSLILAPTLLGTVCLSLAESAPRPDEVLRWLIATLTLSSLIAGLVMHIALAKRSMGVLFGLACVGGFFFVVGTAGIYALLALDFERAASGMFLGATFGAALSIPCGVLFGLLFIGMFGPLQLQLESPSQESLAHAAQALARVLAVASILAMIAISSVEGPYCVTFFSVLSGAFDYQAPEGTDIAWTRFLVGVALLVPALLLGLYARFQRYAFRSLRAALGRRELASLSISDLSPASEAMPLTEADRAAPRKLLLEASTSELEAPSCAYRHHARPEPVYVGIIGTPELPQ